MASSKIFHDPIHGQMEIHPLLVKIIDTPEFQRLRNLKQLGGAYYVYPGATHNRYEHCIGTSYLAGYFIEKLKENHAKPESKIKIDVTEGEVLCLKIAGLCHDLGHGPYSHAFDGGFINKCKELDTNYREIIKEWTHEEGSMMMFESIFEQLQNEFAKYFTDLEKTFMFIKELIDPPKPPKKEGEWPYRGIMIEPDGSHLQKAFLYEIISNARNKIDVDKFDYLARDSHHVGFPNNFIAERYMKMARVMKCDGAWQICVRDKNAENVYELFQTRERLHRRVYQHHANCAVEIMVTDAFVKALPYYNVKGSPRQGGRDTYSLVEAIRDPKAYCRLRDSIYYAILDSDDPNLKDAAAILQRIENRDLYKLVGETKPYDTKEEADKEKKRIKDEMKQHCPSIILENVAFSFGNKDKNPVDNVRFFDKNEENPRKLEVHEVSKMLPAKFQEVRVRVYYTGQDKDKFTQCRDMFKNLTSN